MEKNRIQLLLNKYFSGTCTEEEMQELDAWYDRLGAGNHSPLPEDVLARQDQYVDEKFALLSRIIDKQPAGFHWRGFLRVAAVLLLAGAGLYMFTRYTHHPSAPSQKIAVVRSAGTPGHEGAVLTLANGQQVMLDSMKGFAVLQGRTRITNTSGQLSYHTTNTKTSEIAYNALTTPRGRQYTLVLPDGTKAMLNAASSIRYPTAFAGSLREVEITGEVYFEVAHNDSAPFIVTANEVKVSVLGTHFDVNAYGDDGLIKTTLLQGAVKVANGSRTVLIAPGEQAAVSESLNNITVKKVDPEKSIAWTQGFLSLEDKDIKEFMANLSRWYDMDIVYEGKPPSTSLGGLIDRKTNLWDVLSTLETYGIHTRIEGRKIIVSD